MKSSFQAVALLLNLEDALGHGSTKFPPSRGYFCRFQKDGSEGCGNGGIGNTANVWEPQSIGKQGVGGIKANIPNGNICSAGLGQFSKVDTTPARLFTATRLEPDASGETFTMEYWYTAPHQTKFHKVYITKPSWDYKTATGLSWSDLEDEPFCEWNNSNEPPNGHGTSVSPTSWKCKFPADRAKGSRVMFVVFWQRSDSPEAFMACSDVIIGGSGSGSGSGSEPSDKPAECLDPPPTNELCSDGEIFKKAQATHFYSSVKNKCITSTPLSRRCSRRHTKNNFALLGDCKKICGGQNGQQKPTNVKTPEPRIATPNTQETTPKPTQPSPIDQGKRSKFPSPSIQGYITGWSNPKVSSLEEMGEYGYNVAYLAFARVAGTKVDLWDDGTVGPNGTFKRSKKQDPKTPIVILSLGGINHWTWKPDFNNLQQLAKNMVTYCSENALHGVDFDLEGDSLGIKREDVKAKYSTIRDLITKIRLEAESRASEFPRGFFITAAPQTWADEGFNNFNLYWAAAKSQEAVFDEMLKPDACGGRACFDAVNIQNYNANQMSPNDAWLKIVKPLLKGNTFTQVIMGYDLAAGEWGNNFPVKKRDGKTKTSSAIESASDFAEGNYPEVTGAFVWTADDDFDGGGERAGRQPTAEKYAWAKAMQKYYPTSGTGGVEKPTYPPEIVTKAPPPVGSTARPPLIASTAPPAPKTKPSGPQKPSSAKCSECSGKTDKYKPTTHWCNKDSANEETCVEVGKFDFNPNHWVAANCKKTCCEINHCGDVIIGGGATTSAPKKTTSGPKKTTSAPGPETTPAPKETSVSAPKKNWNDTVNQIIDLAESLLE